MMPDYPCGTVGYPLWKFPGKSRQPGSSWLFSFLFCNKQRLINGVSLFFLHLYVFSFFLFPFFLPFIKKKYYFFLTAKKKVFWTCSPSVSEAPGFAWVGWEPSLQLQAPDYGEAHRVVGEGGVEMVRQESEPSHTALSTKSLMLILLTQHWRTVFILYPFLLCCLDYKCSGPSPQVVPVPIAVSVIPPSCPTPPLLWLSVILCPDHFLQQKKKKQKLLSILPTYRFLLSLAIPYSEQEHSQTTGIHHPLGCPLHQAP